MKLPLGHSLAGLRIGSLGIRLSLIFCHVVDQGFRADSGVVVFVMLFPTPSSWDSSSQVWNAKGYFMSASL